MAQQNFISFYYFCQQIAVHKAFGLWQSYYYFPFFLKIGVPSSTANLYSSSSAHNHYHQTTLRLGLEERTLGSKPNPTSILELPRIYKNNTKHNLILSESQVHGGLARIRGKLRLRFL